jgi:hypothetical protein
METEGCLESGCGFGRIVCEMVRTLLPRAIAVRDGIDEGARFTAALFGVKHVPAGGGQSSDASLRYGVARPYSSNAAAT